MIAILPKNQSELTSIVITGKSKGSDDALPEKVVLNDECGDSLWDQVLSQEDEPSHNRSSLENKNLPDDDHDGQE